MLKKLTLTFALSLLFVGAATAGEMILDQSYEGPYWAVATHADGSVDFRSVQSGDPIPTGTNGPSLRALAIDWNQDKNGKITGSATFLSIENKGTVKVILDGFSPEPAAGQDYRTASVNVTIDGGTGEYQGATGTAKVEAKLTAEGVSFGRIVGKINVPG